MEDGRIQRCWQFGDEEKEREREKRDRVRGFKRGDGRWQVDRRGR